MSKENKTNADSGNNTNSADENKLKKVVSVDTENSTVRRVHETETKAAGIVACDWTFDFSNVSERDLLELASRSILISYRPRFKGLPRDEVIKNQEQTIDVKEFLDSGGTRTKSKVEKATSLIANMTEEEKEQLSMFLKSQAA